MIEPVQDTQTVEPDGTPVAPLPHGVTFHETATHIDARGSLCEMFDPRWGWHPDPLCFVYMFSIRPGIIKGWGLHKTHEDRYFVLQGEMLVVLYDEREDSPTRGLVSEVVLSEYNRRLMNIPAGIWHADRNLGTGDVVVINFPTIQYDHRSPDKYRLPLNHERIPYTFDNPRGW